MSSGDFSDIIIKSKDTQLPILLDQIAIYLPIYTATPEQRWIPNQKGEKKGPELVDHPLTAYVADPRVYHHPRGKRVLYPFGREVVLTNGRRIFKAMQGNPLTHCSSGKRAPQRKSIKRHELQYNQFTEDELRELLSKSDADKRMPYKLLLSQYLETLAILATSVIYDRKLLPYNNINPSPLSAAWLSRIEIYIEIPYANKSDEALRKALDSVLVRAFGKEKNRKFFVEEDRGTDEDEVPSIIKWSVPSSFLSPQLADNGKHHIIKFYRKGPRVRLEIQLNSPSLAKHDGQELEDLLNGVSCEERIKAIADIAANCLRTIEKTAHQALSEISSPSDVEDLENLILARWKELLPRSWDSTPAKNVRTYLAKNGYIDLKTAESFGVGGQVLKQLANKEYGFLKRKSKGLNPNASRRSTNANYELEKEFLVRIGRPEIKQAQNKESIEFQRILERIKQSRCSNANQASIINAVSGAAAQTRLAAILVPRK